jgi:3-dehydroquinate synthase
MQRNTSTDSVSSRSSDSGYPESLGSCSSHQVEVHGPEDNINQVGLNGLRLGGTSGLQTGKFTASAVIHLEYTVEQVSGLLEPSNLRLLTCKEASLRDRLKRFVVLDHNVDRLYGERIRAYFTHHNVDTHYHVLQALEEHKTFEAVLGVCEAIKKFGTDRRDPILAFGGGVVLDVAALAANLWRRNTPIIKIPTTLLANIDASIGVKTACNFLHEKNKLGTYNAPLAVFLDAETFLPTTSDRQMANGMGEILKMALIKDATLFQLLEKDPRHPQVVRRAIQGMLEELEPNFEEATLYRIVDFGHTFSPMLEIAALSSPKPLLHGEAVAIDMVLCMILSEQLSLVSSADVGRVLAVVNKLGLPTWHDSLTLDMLLHAQNDTIKSRGGKLRLPVVNGSIGQFTFLDSVEQDVLTEAFNKLASLQVPTNTA